MKRLIVLALIVASIDIFALTDEEEGGYMVVWPKDHGTFFVVNAQSKVPESVFQVPVNIFNGEFRFDFKLVSGTAPDIRAVKSELAKLGAKGAIWIVDDPELPLCLGACENGWGFVNVAELVLDNPSPEKLASRATKLFNRTFANIHGVGVSDRVPHCVMETAVGVEGLDRLVCSELSPEPFPKISAYMNKMGYKSGHRGTYYDGCEGGWAPLPTNDIQRAIWEKVHKLPTNPMKILPESQRK